jgi:hypothetical protein
MRIILTWHTTIAIVVHQVLAPVALAGQIFQRIVSAVTELDRTAAASTVP